MGKILAQRCIDDPNTAQVFPSSTAKAIPFHVLRKPVVQSVVLWKKLMDRFYPCPARLVI